MPQTSGFETLIDKKIDGVFWLNVELTPFSTEDEVSRLSRRIDDMYEEFRAHSKIGPFTPSFVLRRAEGKNLKLEITAPADKPLGVIPLRIKQVGVEKIITCPKVTQSVRSILKYNDNSGLSLASLHSALKDHKQGLDENSNIILDKYLALFPKDEPYYSFDIDRTDDSLTIVAFVNLKRLSVVTVFY